MAIVSKYLKPPSCAGLDAAAHLRGVVNSLYVLISATICIPAPGWELVEFIPGGERGGDCLFCAC